MAEQDKQQIINSTDLPPVAPVITSTDVARNKIKDNKILFYGIPLMVLCVVLGGLFFFVMPTVQYYSEFRSKGAIVDENSKTVDKSIDNLLSVYDKELQIKSYDTLLSSYVPVESKLGDILNIIQTKAQDFGLESQVGAYGGADTTSVVNLAKDSEGEKKFIESISSGEVQFQPKSLSEDVDAVLISIEVNIMGDRDAFLNFLSEMQGVKPIVNLVYAEYSESETTTASPTVIALLRFESYALKLNTENVSVNAQSKPITVDDPRLTSTMREEKFEIDVELTEKLQNLAEPVVEISQPELETDLPF